MTEIIIQGESSGTVVVTDTEYEVIEVGAGSIHAHEATIGNHRDVTVTNAAVGDVLTFNGTMWAPALPTGGGGGGGATFLSALSDVADTTVPTSGQVLRGNGATWVNSAIQDGDLPASIARDAEVTSLIAAHEADTTNVHGIANTQSLVLTTDSRLSDARTPTAHTHPFTAITGTATDAQIPASIARDTEVTAAVDAHIASTDPHPTYQTRAEKGAASGYASLDGSGRIPSDQLPALAITSTFVVSSQAAMLALTAQEGDVAIRTDFTPRRAFILRTNDPTLLTNWEALDPATTVTSVDGRTGEVALADLYIGEGQAAGGALAGTYPNPSFAVDMATQAELDAHANRTDNPHTTTKAQVGLGNVDNTSDVNKPVSTAQQAALDAKATMANTVMDGDAAGGVLSGAYPNPGFATDMATQAELDAHVNDAIAAHAATAVSFTPSGTIAATNVQAAIEEVVAEGSGSGGATSLPGLSDVADGTVATTAGHVLRASGTEWVNSPITDADVPATIARDSEVTAAIDAHVAAVDPHPAYQTQAESDTRYVNETDHTKAAHDALLIDAATLDGIDSTGFAASGHNHDATYVNESDHTKAAHDALLIDAATLDGLDSSAFQARDEKGQAAGYASLDGAGKVPSSQLPALAITSTFVVASEAAMTGLTAEEGDIAIRTDFTPRRAFILRTNDPTIVGNWEALDPATSVTSVEGRTGDVDLSDLFIDEGQAAGGVLAGTYPNPAFAVDMATQAELDAHEADTTAVHGIADTAALVTTTDPRLTDQRTPTDGSVTNAKVATGAAIAESKLDLASDAAAGTPSRRTLGTGATQAAAGNDPRLSDARTPTAHGPAFHSGNSDLMAMVMGRSGAIPAATAADQADFLVIVPYDVTLYSLRASARTAPTALTTLQVRRSTDSGATFADAFGTVSLAANAKAGSSDPADLNVNAGDLLNFSITAGGGSGDNLLVQVIAKAR